MNLLQNWETIFVGCRRSSICPNSQSLKLYIIQDHYVDQFELTGEKYSDEICEVIHS